MDLKQRIFFLSVVGLLVCLCSLIFFGDRGLRDLHHLRRERDDVVGRNDQIAQKNLSLFREIDRLKQDLTYIEHVARQQLGYIRPGEVILKTNEAHRKQP